MRRRQHFEWNVVPRGVFAIGVYWDGAEPSLQLGKFELVWIRGEK